MAQKKKVTSHEDPYRRLVEEAAKEVSLRRVLRGAGVSEEEVLISQWLNGRKDRNGKWYFPPLRAEVRKKLFAFLKAVYPRKVAEIEGRPRRACLKRQPR